MKNRSLILAFVLAGAAAGLVVPFATAQNKPATASAPTKVAVCDMELVFKNYDKANDIKADLDQKAQNIKSEADARTKALDKITQQLESLKSGSGEYEAKVLELTRLSVERDSWLAVQQQLTTRERHRRAKEMYKDISDTIAKVAKERGYDLVLYIEPAQQETRTLEEMLQVIARRKVLYNDPSLDITDLVLPRLNEQYKAAKGK